MNEQTNDADVINDVAEGHGSSDAIFDKELRNQWLTLGVNVLAGVVMGQFFKQYPEMRDTGSLVYFTATIGTNIILSRIQSEEKYVINFAILLTLLNTISTFLSYKNLNF